MKEKITSLRALSLVAAAFGGMTLASASAVLFSESASVAAGAIIPFIVWFNLFAGFGYILVALFLWRERRAAITLALLLLLAYLIADGALALHMLQGGAYEPRTVLAMTFRTLFWGMILLVARQKFPGTGSRDEP